MGFSYHNQQHDLILISV